MNNVHYLCKHGLSSCARCGTDDDRAAFAEHTQTRTAADNTARAIFWNTYALALIAVAVHYFPEMRAWIIGLLE